MSRAAQVLLLDVLVKLTNGSRFARALLQPPGQPRTAETGTITASPWNDNTHAMRPSHSPSTTFRQAQAAERRYIMTPWLTTGEEMLCTETRA